MGTRKPLKPRAAAGAKKKPNTKKPAAKKPAAKKPATRKPAASKRKTTTAAPALRSRQIDPEAVRQAFQDARAKGGGPRVPYMKFQAGKQSRVRLIPIPGSAVPFIHFRAHGLRPAGQKYPQTMLDYRWLTSDGQAELLERLLAEKRITEADLSAHTEFGEAPTAVAAAAKEQEIETKRSLWAANKYMFLALERSTGEVKVWETGPKFAQEFLEPLVAGTYDEDGELVAEATHPELFDLEDGFDILVSATGEGLRRRYTYTVDRRPSAAEVPEDAKIPDPFAVLARYARPYKTKVMALFHQEGEIAKALKFTPEQFGVGGTPVDSTESDDNDPLGDAFG